MKKILLALVITSFLSACSSGSNSLSVERNSAPTTLAVETPTTALSVTTTASMALMPDVMCMNLQAAQDFIQFETGVFLSLSEDATGQGRSQIIDSNWVVVGQRPSVGTPIGEGDAVLSVVKIGEPGGC